MNERHGTLWFLCSARGARSGRIDRRWNAAAEKIVNMHINVNCLTYSLPKLLLYTQGRFCPVFFRCNFLRHLGFRACAYILYSTFAPQLWRRSLLASRNINLIKGVQNVSCVTHIGLRLHNQGSVATKWEQPTSFLAAWLLCRQPLSFTSDGGPCLHCSCSSIALPEQLFFD